MPESRSALSALSLVLCLSIPSAGLAAGASGSESAAAADTQAVAPVLTLPSVVVTAPRVPMPLAENPAATSIVADQLHEMQVRIGADEALEGVPGLVIDNQAGGERVHVSSRGIGILTERGVRGIKVLLDGLPLNDPSGFAPDFFDVDWATVSSIEVMRGPASALYGGGAAGGIIDITTQEGGSLPFGGRLSVTGGSYGFYKALGQMDGASEGRDWRVTASRMKGDGYRQHTQFSATNFYTRMGWRLGERGRLTGIVAGTNFFNENAEGLNTGWLAEDRRQANPDALTYDEYQRTRRATVGVAGTVPVRENDEFSFRGYVRGTRFDESVPSSVIHREIGTPGGGAQYTLAATTGSVGHRVAVGVDLDGQTIAEYRRPHPEGSPTETGNIVVDETLRQRSVGTYLIERATFCQDWSVILGARYDAIRNELVDNLRAEGTDLSGLARFHRTTARVGAAWNPREAFGVYASWGQGFLPPATEELANNPAHLGGFNANLKPATSNGEEIGVRGALANFSYNLTGFYLDTENDFGRFRVTERPLETFYQNTGKSKRFGVETELTWLPIPDATLRLVYTYSHFRYDHAEYNGVVYHDTWVPNSPQHVGFLDGEYRFARHFAVGASVEMRSHWFVDPSNLVIVSAGIPNMPSVDGYTLLHARLTARCRVGGREYELMVGGRNITGVKYIAFTEPDPDGNSYQPAATAEWFATASARF